MKAKNTSTDSLAFVWSGRLRIRRALFFTYRFNFRWFHDFILPALAKKGISHAEITVVASRFGDEDDVFPSSRSGDLYGIEEWAHWRKRFRIRYLPADPMTFHAKFILFEVEGRSAPILGGGSANLTSAGWLRNGEVWSWDERPSLAACRAYLQHVSKYVGGDILSPWIRLLPKTPAPRLSWLFGAKERARTASWDFLCDTSIGNPTRLTIVSPYYDSHSTALLTELLTKVRDRFAKTPDLHLWIDGSGQVARRSDYVHISEMVKTKPVKVFAPVIRDDHGTESRIPLHMKAIEVLGTTGRRMLFGSANFTGAAWKGANHETLFGDSGPIHLDRVWRDGRRLASLPERALTRLIDRSPDDESTNISRNLLYWAVFDERALRLTLSARRPNEIARVVVEASCDPRRVGDEKRRLDAAAAAFSDASNWGDPVSSGDLITKTQHERRQLPERLSVRVIWTNGDEAQGPVEVSDPDFDDLRDPGSGIPWDLSDTLSGLCAPKRPIASALPRKTTFEASGEEVDDEEELADPPDPSTLSADPEYHHVPEGVLLARAIRIATPERRKEMRRLIALRKPIARDPLGRLLLEATRLALDDE